MTAKFTADNMAFACFFNGENVTAAVQDILKRHQEGQEENKMQLLGRSEFNAGEKEEAKE